MLASGWFRFGLLLIVIGVFMALTTAVNSGQPIAHGQRLVAQYQLPAEAIERYADLAAGTAGDELRRENSRFADALPWVGPAQRAGAGHNPYTLVFTVNGAARAAGEVFATWQTGWEVQESPEAIREVLMAVPGIASTVVSAGQPVTLTASSERVSFKGERMVAPKLGLVHMHNLDIHDVQVQLWSGAAPMAWPVLPLPHLALLLAGFACLLLGMVFHSGRRTMPEPAAQ